MPAVPRPRVAADRLPPRHRGWRRALCCLALLGGLAAAAPARAQGAGAPLDAPVLGQLTALEAVARAHPRDAIARLAALLHTLPPQSPARVLVLTLRGTLQAAQQEHEEAQASLRQLELLADLQPWAGAAAAMLRAAQAVHQKLPLARADRLAAEATRLLPPDAPALWRLRLSALHATIHEDRGALDDALRLRHRAVALADGLGDAWRRSDAQTRLAYALLLAGQTERGEAALQQALALARGAGDDLAISKALNTQAFFRAAAGDATGERRAMEGAIDHARRAGSRQDTVLGLANLADHYLKRGQFETALRLSREALPQAREIGDRVSEGVALANIGLALISLRQPAEGLRYIRQSMALDEQAGALASMAAFELEVGGYLERAGYLREALAAYRRQRRLADMLSLHDQQQAILELQESQDHERRQRELELLHRENALKQAALTHQTLQRQQWAGAAVAAAGLLALALALLARLRRDNAALQAGNTLLRTLGEQDALTGLANRRHLQRVVQADAAEPPPFEGALLLIDIDHFKRINDRLGHAGGDQVLRQTAQRLREALRAEDLLARWGGEEFLVLARGLTQAQLEQLAQRLLHAIGDTPMVVDGRTLAVTASIGHARFPCEHGAAPVRWDRALALVDTALYLAKAHGRNLAYGVRGVRACDDALLLQLSQGLEAAWQAGRVELVAARGPQAVTPGAVNLAETWPAPAGRALPEAAR